MWQAEFPAGHTSPNQDDTVQTILKLDPLIKLGNWSPLYLHQPIRAVIGVQRAPIDATNLAYLNISKFRNHQGVSELMAQARLQPTTPQEQWSRITIEKVHTPISEMLN
jgi:hypothetical protein